MNLGSLEMLKRLYAGSEDWIMIADENWDIVWNSRDTIIPDPQRTLILTADWWENTIRPFTCGNALYHCYIHCSREDGLRVLRFQPALSGVFDFTVVTDIVQAMVSTCTALYHALDDDSARDCRPYLNTLMGNILRIYRMMFIEQQIRHGANQEWESVTLGIQSVLQPITDKVQGLMRQFARVQYECGEPIMYAKGDPKGFRAAILSAMLLCIRMPEMEQDIRITLHREEKHAILCFTASPESEPRRNMEEQCRNFGDISPERQLLDMYCDAFGIRSAFTDSEGTVTCRLEIPLCEPETVIQFRSSAVSGADGYFDPIAVMLARVCLRSYF